MERDNDKTKHIDEKMHFVREVLIRKEFKLWFVPTTFQLADILTKGVTTEFGKHVENLFDLDTEVNLKFICMYQRTMTELKSMERKHVNDVKNRKRSLRVMNGTCDSD